MPVVSGPKVCMILKWKDVLRLVPTKMSETAAGCVRRVQTNIDKLYSLLKPVQHNFRCLLSFMTVHAIVCSGKTIRLVCLFSWVWG